MGILRPDVVDVVLATFLCAIELGLAVELPAASDGTMVLAREEWLAANLAKKEGPDIATFPMALAGTVTSSRDASMAVPVPGQSSKSDTSSTTSNTSCTSAFGRKRGNWLVERESSSVWTY